MLDQLARAAAPTSAPNDRADKYVTVFYQFSGPTIKALTGPNGLPNGPQYEHIFSHSSPGIRAHPELAKLVHGCGKSFKFSAALDVHKYDKWGQVDDAKLKDWAKEFRELELTSDGPADYWAFNEMPTKGFANASLQSNVAKWCRHIYDPGDGGPVFPQVFYFTEQNVTGGAWKQLTDEFWDAVDQTSVLVVGEHYHSYDFVMNKSPQALTEHLLAIAEDLDKSGKPAQQRIAREKYAVLHSSYYGPADTGWHGPLSKDQKPEQLRGYFDRVIDATRASDFGKKRIGFGPLVAKDFDDKVLPPLRDALVADAKKQK